MDGPDLSHLLDDASSGVPSRDVLDGIVRRRRRSQARRARTAATLGLVLVIAGAGVGIGLSHKSGTTTALSPNAGTRPGPSMVGTLPEPGQSRVGLGSAPAGLGWVGSKSGAGFFSYANSLLPGDSVGGHGAGRLQATGTAPGLGTSLCSIWACLPSSSNGSFGDALLRHLFTRTSGGVTVRAFTARWAVAPLELVPVASGTASGGSVPGATGSSSPAGGSKGTSGGATPGSTTEVVPPPPTTGTTGTTGATGITVTTGTEPGSPVPTAVPPVSCAVTQALVVEVSDGGAVGVITVPLGPSLARPITVLLDQVVGVVEQSPMAVVVAHTTGQTAAVLAEFAGGGQDEMIVVDQWAVLVHKLAAAKTGGTGSQGVATMPGQAAVYALSSNGTVLERANLPGSGALAMAVAACLVPYGAGHKLPVSSSSGSPGSGSVVPPAKHNGG
ncbi:MAG: hypothetical protein WAV54_05570 [Acidimicrobiales bacterium]